MPPGPSIRKPGYSHYTEGSGYQGPPNPHTPRGNHTGNATPPVRIGPTYRWSGTLNERNERVKDFL